MKVYDGTGPDDGPTLLKVGIAESEVTADDAVLTTSGLGSCVGVALYDPVTTVGGLVHVMLPTADGRDGDPAKFADTGVDYLIGEMERTGADPNRVRAKLAGGSDMLDFSDDGATIGARNVEQVRAALARNDVPIAGEDLGGDHGRSIRFETETGDLVVKSASRERTTL